MSRTHGSSARLLLDRVNQCVVQGERPVKLTPKAFAILRYLMERQGCLATKDELLAAIWPDTSGARKLERRV